MTDPQALLKKASELDAAGDYLGAAKVYDELMPLTQPEIHGKLHLYKAVSLLNGQKADDAIECFQKAIDSGDVDVVPNAMAGKARALERMKKLAEACDAYQEAVNIDIEGKFVKWADYAHCCNQAEQYDRALKVAAEGLTKEQDTADKLHNERIFAFFKLQTPLKALADVEAALSKRDWSQLRAEEAQLYTAVLLEKGQQLVNQGEHVKAVEYIEKVYKAAPTAMAAFLLGICNIRMGNQPEGVKYLDETIALDHQHWRARVALGMTYILPESGQYLKAANNLKEAMDISAEARTANVFFNHGYALYRLDRSAEAKPSLEFVLQHDKTNWRNAALLGTIVLNEKDYHKAIECLTQAIETSNGEADDGIYYNLAYAYMMLNKYKQAMDNFNKAAELNPSNNAAKTGAAQMQMEHIAEKKRQAEEEEQRLQAEAAKAEAEKQRKIAEEKERQAKKERDEKVRLEMQEAARIEKEKAEKAIQEAIEEAERVKQIKKQEAAERRQKRLEELRVLLGEPQKYRARRKSLELIPVGNTGKNAHAYADWYNKKIVKGEK